MNSYLFRNYNLLQKTFLFNYFVLNAVLLFLQINFESVKMKESCVRPLLAPEILFRSVSRFGFSCDHIDLNISIN